jgi:autotransporter-associated beta strand protein
VRLTLGAAFVLGLAVCGARNVRAESGTWTGAEDAAWTNAANWSAATYPGGVAGESAAFDGGGGVIDLDGLLGIGNVSFTGAAAFTLGAGGANAQTLVLEDGGGLRLAAGAAAGVQVAAAVRLGADRGRAVYEILNDSPSQPLAFAGLVAGAATGGTADAKYLTVGGTGPVTFGGGLDRGGASGLVLTNASSGALTLAGDNMLRALIFTGEGNGAMDIGAGELYLNNASTLVLNAERDAVIGGAGTLRLSSSAGGGSSGFDYSNIIVAEGKTLVIDTPVTGTGGIEFNSGTGTLVLNGLNMFEAHVALNSSGTLSVSKLGNAGSTDSNLGKGSVIRAYATGTGARLLYTGAGETSDRVIRLERNFTLEHAGTGTLTFSSDLDIRENTKTLTLQGGAEGTGVLAGAVSNGTATTSLTKRGAGTWVLAGANSYAGETAVYDGGPLVLTHPAALAGTSRARLYSGVLELAHDGVDEVPFNVSVGVNYSGTILSGNAAGDSAGINHTLGTLDLSSVTLIVARAPSVLSGSPAVTASSVNLSAGTSGATTLNPTTADLILGGAAILANSHAKTLRLAGTSTGSRVHGVISNGLNTLSVDKADAGTWTLTAANTYTGTTTVTDGTLALAGADGALQGTTGITLAGGTLLLDNAADANADRFADTAPLTLAGGTLALAGGSETAGALIVCPATSGVGSAGSAVATGGGTLTFAALAYTGGAVNFAGEGLGEPGGPRIFFTEPPALHGGLIGPWATVNGVPATYDAVNGIAAYTPAPGSETEIDARGPSVIPDDAEKHVRITGDGTEGPVALAADETAVATLTQENGIYGAVVDTAGKTLRASAVSVASGAAPLTLGAAPGDGALAVSTLANDSAGALTVNAALADDGPEAAVGTLGTGAVILNGPVLHTGPLGVNGGTLAFGGSDIPQSVTGVLAGAGTLLKTGTNTLHLLGANTFTGPLVVNAGVLRVEQDAALGAANAGTFIAPDATLDLGVTTRGANTLNMNAEPVVVSGAGAAGAGGAIVNSSSLSQYFALGNVTLAGDAVFGGSARWDIRNGTLAMNDRSVTKTGPDTFGLSAVEVTPGGDGAGFDVREGALRLQTTTRLNGGAANTIAVRDGARLELYQASEPQAWTLTLDGGAAFTGVGGESLWSGSVTLNGAATLDYNGGILNLAGPVSGVGPLTKGTGGNQLRISGTENTYTGMTRVLSGRLVVTSLRNVGQPSSIGQPATPEAGVIRMGNGSTATALEYTGTGDTTDRVVDMAGTTGQVNLYHNGTGPLTFTADLGVSGVGNKTLLFSGASTSPAEFAGRIIDAAGSAVSISKTEASAWTLSGVNAWSGSTTVSGGALTFTASNVNSGVVTVGGAGLLTLAGTGGGLTGEYRINGEMIVSGTNNQGSGLGRVGYNSGSNGVMRILPGASYTGAGAEFTIGNNTGSAGALYVEGGSLTRSHATSDKTINVANGQGSYGYLKISGGTVTLGSRLTVGGYGTLTQSNAYGIVRMTGGTMTIPEYVLLSRNPESAGILTLQGDARFDHANASQNFVFSQNGGRAELNLLGGTLDNTARDIAIRQGSSGTATGIVNLCAGTLTANRIFVKNATDAFRVNFRGGTFKTSAAGVAMTGDTVAVTVFGPGGGFAGGAVIDTDGRDVTVAAPLRAPAGNGVAAVALADGGSGYIGEPLVTIDPPPEGGIPATAVAEIEPDGNGASRVASVTVTCPGSGYAEPPVVTFERGGTLAVQASAGAATLAQDAGGGLTKAGAGTLTLGAANTYAGPTVVNAGTLKLGNAKALPTGTAVVLAGGMLDLNGYTVTNGIGGAGTLANGAVRAALSPGGAGVIGTDALTLAGVSLTGTYLADVTEEGESDLVTVHGGIDLSGLTVTVVDPERLNRRKAYTLLACDGALTGTPSLAPLPDSRWHLTVRPDGTVRLVFTDGTLLYLK